MSYELNYRFRHLRRLALGIGLLCLFVLPGVHAGESFLLGLSGYEFMDNTVGRDGTIYVLCRKNGQAFFMRYSRYGVPLGSPRYIDSRYPHDIDYGQHATNPGEDAVYVCVNDQDGPWKDGTAGILKFSPSGTLLSNVNVTTLQSALMLHYSTATHKVYIGGITQKSVQQDPQKARMYEIDAAQMSLASYIDFSEIDTSSALDVVASDSGGAVYGVGHAVHKTRHNWWRIDSDFTQITHQNKWDSGGGSGWANSAVYTNDYLYMAIAHVEDGSPVDYNKRDAYIHAHTPNQAGSTDHFDTASIEGGNPSDVHQLAADEEHNIYAAGILNQGAHDFKHNPGVNGTGVTWDKRASTTKEGLFVAKLSREVDWKWVLQPHTNAPDEGVASPSVSWNEQTGMLIVTGSFGHAKTVSGVTVQKGGKLQLGNTVLETPDGTPMGFLAVVEPDGDMAEKVELSVDADVERIGDDPDDVDRRNRIKNQLSGILPNGGTTQTMIKGTDVELSVPEKVFLDGNGNLLRNATEAEIRDRAKTRLISAGYSVEDSPVKGSASTYEFGLEKDVHVTFHWVVEFALEIESDFAGVGLESGAAGNPDPVVQKHWIPAKELITARIDGYVSDASTAGTRHIPFGYWAGGAVDAAGKSKGTGTINGLSLPHSIQPAGGTPGAYASLTLPSSAQTNDRLVFTSTSSDASFNNRTVRYDPAGSGGPGNAAWDGTTLKIPVTDGGTAAADVTSTLKLGLGVNAANVTGSDGTAVLNLHGATQSATFSGGVDPIQAKLKAPFGYAVPVDIVEHNGQDGDGAGIRFQAVGGNPRAEYDDTGRVLTISVVLGTTTVDQAVGYTQSIGNMPFSLSVSGNSGNVIKTLPPDTTLPGDSLTVASGGATLTLTETGSQDAGGIFVNWGTDAANPRAVFTGTDIWIYVNQGTTTWNDVVGYLNAIGGLPLTASVSGSGGSTITVLPGGRRVSSNTTVTVYEGYAVDLTVKPSIATGAASNGGFQFQYHSSPAEPTVTHDAPSKTLTVIYGDTSTEQQIVDAVNAVNTTNSGTLPYTAARMWGSDPVNGPLSVELTTTGAGGLSGVDFMHTPPAIGVPTAAIRIEATESGVALDGYKLNITNGASLTVTRNVKNIDLQYPADGGSTIQQVVTELNDLFTADSLKLSARALTDPDYHLRTASQNQFVTSGGVDSGTSVITVRNGGTDFMTLTADSAGAAGDTLKLVFQSWDVAPSYTASTNALSVPYNQGMTLRRFVQGFAYPAGDAFPYAVTESGGVAGATPLDQALTFSTVPGTDGTASTVTIQHNTGMATDAIVVTADRAAVVLNNLTIEGSGQAGATISSAYSSFGPRVLVVYDPGVSTIQQVVDELDLRFNTESLPYTATVAAGATAGDPIQAFQPASVQTAGGVDATLEATTLSYNGTHAARITARAAGAKSPALTPTFASPAPGPPLSVVYSVPLLSATITPTVHTPQHLIAAINALGTSPFDAIAPAGTDVTRPITATVPGTFVATGGEDGVAATATLTINHSQHSVLVLESKEQAASVTVANSTVELNDVSVTFRGNRSDGNAAVSTYDAATKTITVDVQAGTTALQKVIDAINGHADANQVWTALALSGSDAKGPVTVASGRTAGGLTGVPDEAVLQLERTTSVEFATRANEVDQIRFASGGTDGFDPSTKVVTLAVTPGTTTLAALKTKATTLTHSNRNVFTAVAVTGDDTKAAFSTLSSTPVQLADGSASTRAYVLFDPPGENNELTFLAESIGVAGNNLEVVFVENSGASSASAVFSGVTLTVTVPTSGATANQVENAVNGLSNSGIRVSPERFYPFGTIEERQQVPQFVMDRPGSITYPWKTQHLLEIGAAPAKAEGLPYVKIDMTKAGTPAQTDQPGVGSHWFDENTPVRIGTTGENAATNLVLKGWLYANGHFPYIQIPDETYARIEEIVGPASIVKKVDSTGAIYTGTGTFYYEVAVNLTEPTRVTWDYTNNMSYRNVALGLWSERPSGTTGTPLSQIVSGPAGSAIADMRIWDEVAGKYLPLRPGATLLTWTKQSGGEIYEKITAGFPGDNIEDYYGNPDRVANPGAGVHPGGTFATLAAGATYHYRHVAGTRAVVLDPSATDSRFPVSDRFYFERASGAVLLDQDSGQAGGAIEAGNAVQDAGVGSGDGAIDDSGEFTALLEGRSVFLFSHSTTPGVAATGDLTTETVSVKIAKTKPYMATTDWTGAAQPLLERKTAAVDALTIGGKLTSAHDTAGIGTGYLLFAGRDDYAGNYNAGAYDRGATPDEFGPVIPVNRVYYQDPNATAINPAKDLIVVWYEKVDDIFWPWQPALYRQFKWPTSGPHIVVASRLGSDGLDAAGNAQLSYDSALYADVKIYNQADRTKAGYNPNEEHALIAPSFAYLSSPSPPPAAYALRNDLNVTTWGTTYTSDPRVLVQYTDIATAEVRMSVYEIALFDNSVSDARVKQALDPAEETNKASHYEFKYWTKAGEPIFAPYPLNLVIDVNVHNNTSGTWAAPDGSIYRDRDLPSQYDKYEQRTWWLDHRGQGWVVSGNDDEHLAKWESTNAVEAKFHYGLLPEFWHATKTTGDAVAWQGTDPAPTTGPIVTTYPTVWPDEVATLKAGESLTYSGGEYRMDNPAAPGLPGVIGWAAGEKVFDSRNPRMKNLIDATTVNGDWTVRIVSPLEDRRVKIEKATVGTGGNATVLAADLPDELLPAGGRVTLVGVEYRFKDLSASLQRRVFYDSLLKELGIRGYVNDRTLGDSDLTAAPPAVYVLEPNILTGDELVEMLAVSSDLRWTTAVNKLYALTRNPEALSAPAVAPPFGADAFLVGVSPATRDDVGKPLMTADATGTLVPTPDVTKAMPATGLGPGLAVIPNQAFLNPQVDINGDGTVDAKDDAYQAYVTLAENNHEDLGAAPVSLHIMKVRRNLRYRGAVKVILSDNAFEEKAILRHTGDFGTHTNDLVYQWFIREEDGTEQPVPQAMSPDPWQYFSKSGLGKFQVSLEGTGPVILRDNLVFVRYRHVSEIGYLAAQDRATSTGGYASKNVNDVKWAEPSGKTRWDSYYTDKTSSTIDGRGYKATGEWAGAGNSPDVDGKFRPQLVMGWVKRILDAINPYEARIKDFTNNTSPATYSSMIQQAGPRHEGAVALNPDKDVIENHGLIELYTTVLNRAKALSIDLSQPANTPGVLNAILLAATRISDFYMLLGDEAYSDSMDPTIGMANDVLDAGALGTTITAFQNQMPSLIAEELALLRGVDDTFARPVYNRLFWNFTKSQGEAAYAMNYQIDDVTGDGFINEHDAMKRYPQGHGDAWGHYLTAVKMHYDLLRHPFFNWQSRSELYNLMDIVLEVDFLDERRFARAASAKARAGAQITSLTYRSKYTEDPDGQWQGYTDPNEDRAWGVEDWGRRAGQGALFDWMTVNAILPVEAPDYKEGIEHVDRGTMSDVGEISAQLLAIEGTVDQANGGLNPLGVHADAVPFDIDPVVLDRDSGFDAHTHFEQVWYRAGQALANARVAFANAESDRIRLRQVATSTASHVGEAVEQDLAYRDALIEIFGAPYTGQIGAGKAYPAGYVGPDLMLYMYVDNTQIETDNLEVSQPSHVNLEDILPPWVKELRDSDGELFRFYADKGEKMRTLDGASTDSQFLTVIGELSHLTDKSDDTADTTKLYVPYTARSYAYQVPADGSWGSRLESGALQNTIADMVLTEAQLDADIKAYQMAITGLNTMWELIQAKIRFAELNHDAQNKLNKYLIGTGAAVNAINNYIAVADVLYESFENTVEIISEAVPDKQIGGLAVSVPIRPAVKAPLLTANQVLYLAVKGGGVAMEQAEAWLEYGADVQEMKLELDGIKWETGEDLADQLAELLGSLGDEMLEAVEILKTAESLALLAGDYTTTLKKGQRLLQERANWHTSLSARVQTNRYADMALRASHNDALRKYRDTFNLAAKYVYLAAKAYDYEINLPESDPAAAQGLLSAIVQERALGAWVDGAPVIGAGGLAEHMELIMENFRVLRGQMGLNNPRTEAGRFSLRYELFRIKSDAAGDVLWRHALEQHRIDDLWKVPEFRYYCRPFAPHTAGAQPGFVIPFETQVIEGTNFFGQLLAAGDHTYDPSSFATKVRSVGVWFKNYNNAVMAETPRVYLVPAGSDVMLVPTSDELATREWHIVNQRIPAPYVISDSDLAEPHWHPATDSLNNAYDRIVRYSRFRAYHDTGHFDEDEMTYCSRLVGRSVWNTKWVLIIPGSTFLADPKDGMESFIYGKRLPGMPVDGDPVKVRDLNGVNDIKLFFQTYSHSGG